MFRNEMADRQFDDASQLLRIRRLHATISAFVFVECRLAYAVTPTNIGCPFTSFLIFQYLDDLFVCESLLHLSVLCVGGLYIILEELYGIRSVSM